MVHQESLPAIKDKQGWTKEQYQQRSLDLDSQPIGTNKEELGVIAVVMLKVLIEGNLKALQVLCYVLKSDKPLWNGELKDCALVLGTNALQSLGFQIMHPNGSLVQPVGVKAKPGQEESQPLGTSEVHVTLDKKLCLGPFQSKVAKVSLCNSESLIPLGMVVPNTKLFDRHCDFVE